MFEPIRRKLLLSYLLVLAGILLIFSFAVRTVFVRSLKQAQIDELILLGKAAATTADFRGGGLTLTDAFAASKLAARNQAIEWFDSFGTSIGSSGPYTLSSKLDPKMKVQRETVTGEDGMSFEVLAVRVDIFLDDNKQILTGFVRASQSLQSIQRATEQLNWGLSMGSLVALVFSGVGGLWLMRQSMSPIEESFDQLKQFTADASHELRSPLMAISSNAKVALKYSEEMRAGDRDKFEAIASASGQMSVLTQDLLLLARTEKIPSHQTVVLDLTQLLENLIQLYHLQAEEQGISLSLDCRRSLFICADSQQMNRLFTNLLVNALHHTPRNGFITIQGRSLMKQVSVQVKDTGAGIAPNQINKVFNRFWRADSSRSADQGRSGLGLAIAQAIVKVHKGSISVVSTLHQGSCFTVKLPQVSPKKSNACELPDNI